MAADFCKSLDHIEFDLLSQLSQAVVVFRSSFRHARLEAVGAIADAVLGDGPQHFLIKRVQVLDSTMCLLADHRLKGRQHLECRLETDGSRRNSVLAGRLSHDGTDQVVARTCVPNLPVKGEGEKTGTRMSTQRSEPPSKKRLRCKSEPDIGRRKRRVARVLRPTRRVSRRSTRRAGRRPGSFCPLRRRAGPDAPPRVLRARGGASSPGAQAPSNVRPGTVTVRRSGVECGDELGLLVEPVCKASKPKRRWRSAAMGILRSISVAGRRLNVPSAPPTIERMFRF